MIALLCCCVLGASTPEQAVAVAWQDIQQQTAENAPFLRYVWVPSGTREDNVAVGLAVATSISFAADRVLPVLLGGGIVQRWDLRQLAPIDADLRRISTVWEKLAKDRYFYAIQRLRVAVAPFKASDGKTYDFKIEDGFQPGLHLGQQGLPALAGIIELTSSQAGIVRAEELVVRSLTTVNGGLYYEFQGVEEKPAEGTAFDAYLRKFGASEAQAAALRADERAIVRRSKVTGKPRRVDAFFAIGARPSSGFPLVTVTHDIQDGDENDPARSAIRNWLDFKARALEVIIPRLNGTLAYAIFDGDGNLQFSVPDKVAPDTTIPDPYPKILQPAISCIRCHGKFEGYQPIDNDAPKLRAEGVVAFGDFGAAGVITPDVIDRLNGLYGGDFSSATGPLTLARNAHHLAIFRMTGGMGVVEGAAVVSDLYGRYLYGRPGDGAAVSTQTALAELGVVVEWDKAAETFKRMVPKLPPNALGISPEDPNIALLRGGLAISREEWKLVYADVALRFRAQQQAEAQNAKPVPQSDLDFLNWLFDQ